METTTTNHTCSEENAPKCLNWIRTRGGIAVWRSINLSNPGASWSTPATHPDGSPATKPTWEAESTPERIITSTDDVDVCYDREVKRFHVAVRRASNIPMLKVTAGGTRRIRAEVEKAGKGSYYVFDYGSYENAVIMRPDKVITLTEWAANQPKEQS